MHFFHRLSQGFRAVYQEIPNPLDRIEDIGPCSFELTGDQVFLGSENITQERKLHSMTHDVPIDCVWTVRVQENHKIYAQFGKYELKYPNDCHTNYIEASLNRS